VTQPLQLELQYPSGYLQGAIQRSVDMVALGLQAADHLTIEELTIPGSFGQVTPARNRQLSIEDAKGHFRSWVLANGLRDCVEALGTTLEWARKHCVLWAQPGTVARAAGGTLRLSAQFAGAVWNNEIVAGADKFDRLPLPNKFQYLEDKYGVIRPELTDDILSLNAARNCLAHRLGVVGRQDLKNDSDDALVVTWRKLEIRVEGQTGQRFITEPSRVDEGEMLQVGFAPMTRTFMLGQKIEFSASEYVDIATTFMLFGQQLEGNILNMQQRRYSDQETKKSAQS
jgi:hypothetical protein